MAKGLRQNISPLLFKIYIVKALQKWKKKFSGISIELNNTCPYILQFVDDQAVIANSRRYRVYDKETN